MKYVAVIGFVVALSFSPAEKVVFALALLGVILGGVALRLVIPLAREMDALMQQQTDVVNDYTQRADEIDSRLGGD